MPYISRLRNVGSQMLRGAPPHRFGKRTFEIRRGKVEHLGTIVTVETSKHRHCTHLALREALECNGLLTSVIVVEHPSSHCKILHLDSGGRVWDVRSPKERPVMHPSLRALARFSIVPLVFVILVLAGSAFATLPSEKVVYSFVGPPDGRVPLGALVADGAGNLYGTTSEGGNSTNCTNGCGTIFELSPPATAGGAWTDTILHSFQGAPLDGAGPFGALIFDYQGNLYGTTTSGGGGNGGSVFELSPPSTPGGAWTETVLWANSASDATDGSQLYGKVVMDPEGNLYGTTYAGGSHGAGTVFELVAPKISGGHWTKRVLHDFGAVANDGANPWAGLLLRGGVLYGTTYRGGTVGQGIVFELVRKPGPWTESILYNFNGSGGGYPLAGLIADSAGNLYGTTGYKGSDPCACGTVYELSPPSAPGDPWQETTLHSFTGGGDGAFPRAELWRDKSGDLFGTASLGGKGGGSGGGGGTVFKLDPPLVSGGAWAFV